MNMNMKINMYRSSTTLLVFGLMLFAFAAQALASTVTTLSPSTIEVKAGQTFTVNVSVNPQGTPNMVEKIELLFPSNLLSVTSFSQGANWMSLTQPGYDSTDNTGGTLVKTAGYPSGFSTSLTFGTVTFYAKNPGIGTIRLGSNSQAFDANGQTAMSGNTVTVNVLTQNVSTPTNTTTVIPAKTSPTKQNPKINSTSAIAVSSTTASSTLGLASSTQVAASGESRPFNYVGVIVVIAIVLFVWGVYRWFSRRKF
jgi:hypothetical protein